MNTFISQCAKTWPDAALSSLISCRGKENSPSHHFIVKLLSSSLDIFSDPVLFRCWPSQRFMATTRTIDFLGHIHREERLLYPGGKRFTVWKFIFLFILSPTPAHPFGWQLFCQVQYFIITRASNLFRSPLFSYLYLQSQINCAFHSVLKRNEIYPPSKLGAVLLGLHRIYVFTPKVCAL